MFEELEVTPMPAGATDPGFFNSISIGLQSLFARAPAGEPGRPADLDPRLVPYADKISNAEEAVAHIRSGSHVFVGTASATPRAPPPWGPHSLRWRNR